MNRVHLYVRGLTGYAQDMYRITRFKFTNPRSYTKFLAINRLRKKTGAKVFIEAGTFYGATAARCASVFERVFTVELDEKLAEQSEKFLASRKNVKLIRGDAMKVLPSLLADDGIDEAIIFLDGHFSGGVTACGDLPEPAVEELKILARHRDKISAVVVDDFRSFGTEAGYPPKSELLRSAEKYFAGDGYDIAVQLDQLVITRRAAPAARRAS